MSVTVRSVATDDRLAYFEWSLDADSPDVVEEATALDPKSWALTNPALGIRISPDYLEAEARELDSRGFAVERLGVGDWPPVDGQRVTGDFAGEVGRARRRPGRRGRPDA